MPWNASTLKATRKIEMENSTTFQRFDSARTFAIGGVILVALGMLVGELYAIYISHIANGIIGVNWVGVIEAVGLGDLVKLREHFAVIEDLATKRGRTMHGHSHLGAYGLLALVLALVQPYVKLKPRLRLQIALFYLLGSILQVLGVYVSYYAGDVFLYLSYLGALLLIGAIIGTLWGIGVSKQMERLSGSDLVNQFKEPATRYLIKSGVLLILLGMTFGLFYAWQLVSMDEPAMYTAVEGAVSDAAGGDIAQATEKIAHFKRMQSKIAITIAAHSHAIEFGFLMLLLAFVQRFVMLSERWRLRWAQTFSVGAFALPVCVFFATMYGLRAAAFSDLFGSIALVGLCAMIFGMIRHTGVMDMDTVDKGDAP
jgi:hypothetical protein